MRHSVSGVLALVVLAWPGMGAADPAGSNAPACLLFDFESDAELSAWRVTDAPEGRIERAPSFATSGGSALCFTVPAWKQGPIGHAFEVEPGTRDWRPYDRLAFDFTNPGGERVSLALIVSGSRTNSRYSFPVKLPVGAHRRFVVPLSRRSRSVDHADIAGVRLQFTQAPRTDVRLYLDRLVLLARGEPLTDPPPAFLKELAALAASRGEQLMRRLDDGRQAAAPLCEAPGVRRRAEAEFGALATRIQGILDAARAGAPTPDAIAAWERELELVPYALARCDSVARFEHAWSALGLPDDAPRVGFATSMEKILPRGASFDLTAVKGVEVSLARNEKESFQVAVLAADRPLEDVTVRVGELASETGAVFEARHIDREVRV